FNTTLEGRWSGWGVELEDINNDGLTDLFMGFGGLADVPESVTNPWGQPDGLWLQNADGRFEQQANGWGVAGNGSTRAVVLTDLNGDGWLDLLTREIGGEVQAWLAQCGEDHWVDVRLRQGGGNARAIGAVVTATADGQTQRKWMTAGSSGLQSSKPLRAHFGLGSSETVDLEVQWPDGETTRHESIGANRVVTIRRP
ncbi:MAG: CRTAC1 family protein, partial [Myxococcota bacterium]|nr:CRTAC1 family protein [Myxococcota bacterium]